MSSARLIFCLAIVAGAICDGIPLGAGERSDADKPLATLEIPKHGKHLFVPVRVGGRRHTFILDTGCTHSILDESLKRDVGPFIGAAKFGAGDLRVDMLKLFEPPTLFLGDLDIGHHAPVGLIDLAGVQPPGKHGLQGTIGMPSLRNYAVQIDFDLGLLTLFDEHHSPADWGQSVPLMVSHWGMPLVLLSAVGIERQFAIDTGSHITHVDHALLRQLKNRDAVVVAGRSRYGTLLGVADVAKYRLTNLSVADFEHDDLLVNEGDDNIIGLDYLSRYRVTFDFPHWRLYLKKGPLYDRSSDPGRSGLSLRWDHGHILVDTVEPNSAACEAGLKVGDKLIRINGDNPLTMSLFEIRRLLDSPVGCEIPIEVSRPRETICTVLAL